MIGFLSGVLLFLHGRSISPCIQRFGRFVRTGFFGFVVVMITHYVAVLSGGVEWQPNWYVPLGVGFVINNLLVVKITGILMRIESQVKKHLLLSSARKPG